MQIGDSPIFQYHRNNGLLKVGFNIGEQFSVEQNKDKTERAYFVKKAIEAAMGLSDKINKAFIHEVFNDTFVISGQHLMPFKPDIRSQTEKVANVVGNLIFPALLSVTMPGFLYAVVLEKEQRLIQNMRINGMSMHNYWIVNYLCNFAQYILSASSFYLFGRYVSRFSFFTESVPEIILAALFGWGLNQVSLSFLIACFLGNSQNASMLGYLISIVGSIITSTLLITSSVY
jgi:hypothetical protein